MSFFKNSTTTTKNPHRWCWIHTSGGDHYAGRVKTMTRTKSLQLTLDPMVIIRRSSKSNPWQPIKRLGNYELRPFDGCKFTDEGNRLRVQSSSKDEIILSSRDEDRKVIETIIEEIVEIEKEAITHQDSSVHQAIK